MSSTRITVETCREQDNGFTIVELLIALFLAGIVTSAVLAIYVTQNKQVPLRDGSSDLQVNIRAAAVELTAQIRLAGLNVPEGIPKMEGYDTNPDTIIVTFDAGNLKDVRIEHAMPTPSAELRCGSQDLTGVCDGDWLFIYDANTKTGEFFQATQVQYAPALIRHGTRPLSKAYPAGARVYKMNRFKYYIDRSDSLHPNLMVSAPGLEDQVCGKDITDLNIRYVLESGEVADVFPSTDMVREVIIEMNARTGGDGVELYAPYGTGDLTTRARTRNLGS